jgi:hypothetical protein
MSLKARGPPLKESVQHCQEHDSTASVHALQHQYAVMWVLMLSTLVHPLSHWQDDM